MNTDQRKALEKIVRNQIEAKDTSSYDDKNNMSDTFRAKRLRANKIKGVALVNKIAKLSQDKKLVEKELEKLNLKYNSWDRWDEDKEDSDLRVIVRCGDRKYTLTAETSDKEDKEIDKTINDRQRKITETRDKLIAKVWGVDTDFDSLMAMVEKELAKL